MEKVSKRPGAHGTAATRIFVLLLVVCLAECVTGSCLSYGHSCWGAHGKRSGKPPATAPDWYLSRILHRMAVNAEMNRGIHLPTKSDDIGAILQMNLGDEAPSTDRLASIADNEPLDLPYSRNPEAKPMLDDDILTKLKYWQIMRQEPDEN